MVAGPGSKITFGRVASPQERKSGHNRLTAKPSGNRLGSNRTSSSRRTKMSGQDEMGICFPYKLHDFSSLLCGSDQKGSWKFAPHWPVESRPFSDMSADHLGSPL